MGGRFAGNKFRPQLNRSHPRSDDDAVQIARLTGDQQTERLDRLDKLGRGETLLPLSE